MPEGEKALFYMDFRAARPLTEVLDVPSVTEGPGGSSRTAPSHLGRVYRTRWIDWDAATWPEMCGRENWGLVNRSRELVVERLNRQIEIRPQSRGNNFASNFCPLKALKMVICVPE
jgi:hypothetical protein